MIRTNLCASAAVVLMLAAPALADAPSNDNMADAESFLQVVQTPFVAETSTVEATDEADAPDDCNIGKDVWYSYTSLVGGPTTATTDGSDFDTKLAVYTDNGDGTYTMLDCDDDGGAGLQSLLEFEAAPLTTYVFQVGGYVSSFTGARSGNLVFGVDTALPVELPVEVPDLGI